MHIDGGGGGGGQVGTNKCQIRTPLAQIHDEHEFLQNKTIDHYKNSLSCKTKLYAQELKVRGQIGNMSTHNHFAYLEN